MISRYSYSFTGILMFRWQMHCQNTSYTSKTAEQLRAPNACVSGRLKLQSQANVRLRVKYLGDHRPASTVICCRLLDPRWKLEIEAMAAT